MQKTTLEQWRMFKAVVDTGGFNQAAKVVHKSQSSIHHAVSNLEKALGVALFETVGRRVVLTESGELLIRRGSFLLQEAGRIEAVATSLSGGVESLLRVAVDGAFPQHYVFEALAKVSERYPQVNIEIVDSVLSGTNELIESGEVDIGLSPFMMNSHFNEEICRIRFRAVARNDHALHQVERDIELEDLKGHRQIIVRDSGEKHSSDAGWLGSEQRWTVSNMRSSIELVRKGLGFAWLPEPLIKKQLDNGELLPLGLAQGGQRSASFFLNFKDGDQLGEVAREFIGQLRVLTLDLDE